MTSLKEELGHDISPEAVASALQSAFEQTLDLSLEAGELTDEERASTIRLVREKYGTEGWNARV